ATVTGVQTCALPISFHCIYEGIYEIRLSPNGRWIVFEAVKGGEAPGGATNATLCVVPVSGGPWMRVTDGQFWDDKPRWSPDGKRTEERRVVHDGWVR